MTEEARSIGDLPQHVVDVLNDDARLDALDQLELLPTSRKDKDMDAIASLASSIMQTPIAFVSLLTNTDQHFYSRVGSDIEGTPIEIAFCAYTIAQDTDRPLVVRDATRDERFATNPLVTGDQKVRFYAGAPLIVGGERVGSLCVLDSVAHDEANEPQLKQFSQLAQLASSLLQFKDKARIGDKARTALVQEKKRHVLALEAASIASWVWDLTSNTIECDSLLPQMLGLAPTDRLRSRELFRAIDRRDLGQSIQSLRNALDSDGEYSGEYRVRGSQPERWLAARGRVLDYDASGRPTLVFGVNFDITATKTAEQKQKLLLREINHRVKNTLATVQAMATQTLRYTTEPRDFLDAFNGRLQSLGLAHGLLSDMEWGGIDLKEIVRRQVMPFTQSSAPRIHTSGPAVSLTPDQALATGLILHELGSNALKHGALSVPFGRVDIDWRVENGRSAPLLRLVWQESGGPPVEEPTRVGFGSILIRRSLGKILNSEVDHQFLPNGVRAEISIPLE